MICTFVLLNITYTCVLKKKNNNLVLQVTHMSKNETKWEHPGHQLGCHYSGVVDGDPKSDVSVSLCHGMVSQNNIFFFFFQINSLY